jgi:hypothetical protein
MSTSTPFATSPDSGPSGPHTPPRTPALAKSSPVGKLHKYFLPENREQYQKFGYDETFMRGNFNKIEFFAFLEVDIPESVPDVPLELRGKDGFIMLAKKVTKEIKERREHHLFLYLAFLPT